MLVKGATGGHICWSEPVTTGQLVLARLRSNFIIDTTIGAPVLRKIDSNKWTSLVSFWGLVRVHTMYIKRYHHISRSRPLSKNVSQSRWDHMWYVSCGMIGNEWCTTSEDVYVNLPLNVWFLQVDKSQRSNWHNAPHLWVTYYMCVHKWKW